MKITNAWICSTKKNSISPVFGDLILSDGKIKEIKKNNWKDYIERQNQKLKRIPTMQKEK
ncbi:MAG: hypothetical protein U5K00_16510 [Melioribacteraceae bacterium]|nr:hypothetical protein [Melioribacteraceae bacterium]